MQTCTNHPKKHKSTEYIFLVTSNSDKKSKTKLKEEEEKNAGGE